MPPRGTTVAEFARRQDGLALEAILRLDGKGLQKAIRDHDITMCGYGPVMAMLEAAKALGATEARMLKYANSAEIVRDRSLAVGYGSVVVT
jgi:AmmeMemoRadiSam system protein B